MDKQTENRYISLLDEQNISEIAIKKQKQNKYLCKYATTLFLCLYYSQEEHKHILFGVMILTV